MMGCRENDRPPDLRRHAASDFHEMAEDDGIGTKSVQNNLHVTISANARKFSWASAVLRSTKIGSGRRVKLASAASASTIPSNEPASRQVISNRRQISEILLSCATPTNGMPNSAAK